MSQINPFATLQYLATAHIVSRCLHVIADLGVADALDETPRTATELAELVDVHPGALERIMSLLAAHGVFEVQGNYFRHSPASRLLLADHPQSARPLVRIFGIPLQWRAYGALEHTLRTGQAAAELVEPGGQWSYFASHTDESEIFNAAMVSKAYVEIAGVLNSYNFSRFRTVADIGGGLGHLLQAIIDSTPATNGVLFDLPHVIDAAGDLTSERLTLQAGDFFKDVLPVCDAYVLMHVIHDWGDSEATAILHAVRQAAPDDAKLLLVETIIPEHPGPDWSKTLDIQMMTMLGGMQRTRRQHERLLNDTEFACTQEIDTGAGISIIEAVPVV